MRSLLQVVLVNIFVKLNILISCVLVILLLPIVPITNSFVINFVVPQAACCNEIVIAKTLLLNHKRLQFISQQIVTGQTSTITSRNKYHVKISLQRKKDIKRFQFQLQQQSGTDNGSNNDDKLNSSLSNMMEGIVYMAITVDGKIARPDGTVGFLDEFQQQLQNKEHDNIKDSSDSLSSNQLETSRRKEEGDDDMLNFSDFLATIDVIVMGRRTFETVLSFGHDAWPYGKIPLIVWTRDTDYDTKIPDYHRQTVHSSCLPPQELFYQIEQQQQRNKKIHQLTTVADGVTDDTTATTTVYIDGGLAVRQFLQAGLIKRLMLSRIPIILGDGISLFDSPSSIDVGTNLRSANSTEQESTSISQFKKLQHVRTKIHHSTGIVETEYRVSS